MSVTAVQNKQELNTGDVWLIAASVRDLDGCLTDAVAPVVTITLPDGTTATPTVERVSTGTYRSTYTPATAGRYLGAAVAAGYGTADLAFYASGTTTETGMWLTVGHLRTYLGDHSWSDAAVLGALNAEAAAQRRVCRIGAVYPADLREALLRRVQRNLAMRGQPYAVLENAEPGAQFIPGNDPEVRRLERPHRKVVLG